MISCVIPGFCSRKREEHTRGFSNVQGFQVSMRIILGRRPHQQDALGIGHKDASIYVIACDGASVTNAENKASRVAAMLFMRFCGKQKARLLSNMTCSMFQSIDDQVLRLRSPSSHLYRAGTTAVAIGVYADSLTWVAVGDSNPYFIAKLLPVSFQDFTFEIQSALPRCFDRIKFPAFCKVNDVLPGAVQYLRSFRCVDDSVCGKVPEVFHRQRNALADLVEHRI